jgi:hypothetical protein
MNPNSKSHWLAVKMKGEEALLPSLAQSSLDVRVQDGTANHGRQTRLVGLIPNIIHFNRERRL